MFFERAIFAYPAGPHSPGVVRFALLGLLRLLLPLDSGGTSA
ncbi:MAG: hypothetical protein OQK99_05040 [Gammaproteobacteria bacterium]|jgi:hypothetical protein|nr:hypothetical protein [Gammaproteobacteria bacterium]